MASGGFAIYDTDSITVDSGTNGSGLDIQPTTYVAPTQLIDTTGGDSSSTGNALQAWTDATLDSTGDEGYVGSAGVTGGGNSTSSNNPNVTSTSQSSPGSPTSGFDGIAGALEDIGKVASTAAAVGAQIEGKPTGTPLGKLGQSAPVKGSQNLSLLQRLFGPASGQAAGTQQASYTGLSGIVTVAVIGIVLVVVGVLAWKGVRG